MRSTEGRSFSDAASAAGEASISTSGWPSFIARACSVMLSVIGWLRPCRPRTSAEPRYKDVHGNGGRYIDGLYATCYQEDAIDITVKDRCRQSLTSTGNPASASLLCSWQRRVHTEGFFCYYQSITDSERWYRRPCSIRSVT